MARAGALKETGFMSTTQAETLTLPQMTNEVLATRAAGRASIFAQRRGRGPCGGTEAAI
jgi:hypothetical protein